MSRETIFEIACEMLQTTNIFNKDISEIKYTNNQQEEISLLALVKMEAAKNHRYRGRTEFNLCLAYNAIAKAMPKYLDSGYSASFSFKQRTRENFECWLMRIGAAYDIEAPDIPVELKIAKNERDTGVTMLKLLHARNGVSYEELQKGLGDISDRAVQKNLVKISPSLYTGNGIPDVPFRLGGQPLLAEIKLVNKNETRAENKRFRTLNSIHPLVLQENIMQLATLLKALCHQYYNYQDDLSVLIAIDIWSQMSTYAQEKMKKHFAFDDADFAEFISILEDECPDDHVSSYRTERDLLNEIEMPIDQALPFLTKAEGRTGRIFLTDGTIVKVQQLLPVNENDGVVAYQAIDCDGNNIIFTKQQIKDIELK